MRVLLLIPAFNEEPTVGPLILSAKRHIEDILVVDDGSRDGTGSMASQAGAVVLGLERNMGKGAALKIGFNYALEHRYDYVLTIDADGQHDPNDIPNFLPLLEQYDLVLGNRMEQSRCVPLLRRVANLTSSRIVSAVCRRRIYDSQTGFRLYGAELLRRVGLDCSRFDLETEVIIKAARKGFRIGHCRIQTIYAGEVSRFKNIRDSLAFIRVVVRCLWPDSDWRQQEASVYSRSRHL
jgi:glycosyltransferase involved in cell wall biosynthesis